MNRTEALAANYCASVRVILSWDARELRVLQPFLLGMGVLNFTLLCCFSSSLAYDCTVLIGTFGRGTYIPSLCLSAGVKAIPSRWSSFAREEGIESERVVPPKFAICSGKCLASIVVGAYLPSSAHILAVTGRSSNH